MARTGAGQARLRAAERTLVGSAFTERGAPKTGSAAGLALGTGVTGARSSDAGTRV